MSERGFSLIDAVVAAAMLALLISVVLVPRLGRAGTLSAATTRLQAVVAEARAYAEANADPSGVTGSTIGLRYDATTQTTAAVVYDGRPLAIAGNAAATPLPAIASIEPQRIPARIELAGARNAQTVPLALMISSSGAASIVELDVQTGETIAAPPRCDPTTGIVLTLDDGSSRSSVTLTCEMAQIVPP